MLLSGTLVTSGKASMKSSKRSDLKDQLKEVEEKLSSTYIPKAKELLGYDGKDFGTINIFHGNDTIKAVLSKKVTWDQICFVLHWEQCRKKTHGITGS